MSRQQRERAAASGKLPHEILLAAARGEAVDGYTPSFAERLDAAKAAAPFYAPKLSSVTATHTHQPAANLHDDELRRRIAQLESDLAGGLSGDAAPAGGPIITH